MTSRLRLFACLALAAPALRAAEPAQRLHFTAKTHDQDLKTGELVLKEAEVTVDGGILSGEEVRYNLNTRTALARGQVVLTQGARRMLAEEITYDGLTGTFTVKYPRLGEYPFVITGQSGTGSPHLISILDAEVSYGEPGTWVPSLKTSRLDFNRDDGKFSASSAFLGLGSVRPLPIPSFKQGLGFSFKSFLSLQAGYRGNLGAFLDAGLRIPVLPGVRAGFDLGIFTRRGLLFGPGAVYDLATGAEQSVKGHLRTGYINDHGKRLTDVLGNSVPEQRSFIEWEHHQKLSSSLSIDGLFNDWRDSEFLRDFRRRHFYAVQVPDSYLEVTYAGENLILSTFGRFHPNSYFDAQERLPEIRADLLPMRLPLDIYQRGSASFVRLRDNPPGSAAPTLQADRADAYYALTRSFTHQDWFSATAVLGGRVTEYSGISGTGLPQGSVTRLLGETGLDAHLLASRSFAYSNPRWGIDGLRHLVKPFLSYRYIPEGGKDRSRIPRIDREVFGSYLQPLGLGDPRHIDDLHGVNTLRLGIENTVQTRDSVYGSRDLFSLTLANDFRFQRQAGEKELSDTHLDLALMPARWLRLEAYERFSPRTLGLHELNTGFTLHDGQEWSLNLSTHRLKGDINEYVARHERRINEVYRAYVKFHYDSRRSRMTEHSYGLLHNLSNVWMLRYEAAFFNGPRREGSVEFRIDVEARAF